MRVFNGCCKVMLRHINAVLIYLILFVALSVLMTSLSFEQRTDRYEETRTTLAIINRDRQDSALLQGLSRYLAANTQITELPDDKEAMQDALFFHAADYILIIPEGFVQALWENGKAELEKATVPDSYTAIHTDALVDQYCNLVKLYRAAAPNMEEQQLAEAVANDLAEQTSVEVREYGSAKAIDERLTIFLQMLSYILLTMVIMETSIIMLVFNRPDLRMHNLCTPVPQRKIHFQIALCNGIAAVASWALTLLIGVLLFGQELFRADWQVLVFILLDSFVYTIVALSIAFFAGQFLTSSNMQNAVANFLALALSFLGGAFVPLEMLGDGMLAVAHFTPTYWYVSTIGELVKSTGMTSELLGTVWTGILVQAGFAAAFFSVALFVSKMRRQSSSGFGRTTTELSV